MTTQILANAKVCKLREYRRSYGSEEIINVPYLRILGDKIELLNKRGQVTRTMKLGTKLLTSFDGKEISELAFKRRTNAAKAKFAAERAEAARLSEISYAEKSAKAVVQLEHL